MSADETDAGARHADLSTTGAWARPFFVGVGWNALCIVGCVSASPVTLEMPAAPTPDSPKCLQVSPNALRTKSPLVENRRFG